MKFATASTFPTTQLFTLPVSHTVCLFVSHQASSSLDPTFWPTHPTMERLWMYKRLTGTMTDLTWPDDDITYTTDSGETVVEFLNLGDDICNGHRGSDKFPFGLMAEEVEVPEALAIRTGTVSGDAGDEESTIANRDFLQLLDPRMNSMTYIYDTFEWKHCKIDGYDMSDAWDYSDKPGSSKRPTFSSGDLRYPLYRGLIEEVRKQAASKG